MYQRRYLKQQQFFGSQSNLETEVSAAKQMLGVREREVAQLEAQLVNLRQASDSMVETRDVQQQIEQLTTQIQVGKCYRGSQYNKRHILGLLIFDFRTVLNS